MAAGASSPETALQALAPLARASLENALAMGPAQALTGPVQRGDGSTVAAHLKALRGMPGTVQALYRAAGLHTLVLARQRGLPASSAALLEDTLK
jgi:predicted short-subunit dehydrogenase-like oxidoreductase (DUF2520 family)